MTKVKDAWGHPNFRNIKHFLMALHFLKGCPTELEREETFGVSSVWGRDWCYFLFRECAGTLRAFSMEHF
jgi:hypothetical protein